MLWWTYQWRGPQASFGLLTWGQGRCSSENDLILGKEDKVLQSEGEVEAFQSWRYGSAEGITSHQRSKWRKVRPQLGRSIKGRLLFKRRSYYLEDVNGKLLPCPWNAEHLKKYCQWRNGLSATISSKVWNTLFIHQQISEILLFSCISFIFNTLFSVLFVFL